MSKFKVGDTVRVVVKAYVFEEPGRICTVARVLEGLGSLPEYIELREYLGEHPHHNFDSRRYELVQAAPPSPAARKDDSGKLDMNLLDDMPRALAAITEVMQWAVEKKKPTPYERGSWLGVSADRYRAAIKRHDRSACEQATPAVPARLQRDAETDLLHLAHQACSAMMALENTLRELEKAK